MARRGGLTSGGRAGNENAMASIGGIVAGVIADFIYTSLRIPGYNQQSVISDLSIGDLIQMLGGFAITAYGFSQGNSRIAPFGFGIITSQVATKVIFPALGFDRYLIFDIDSQGRLVPSNMNLGDIRLPR